MFFDKILVENSELRRVWRAGFGRMEEPEDNTSFPNICRDLNECVSSEDPHPRSRLSLRTSSVLVEGAARIYSQELSRLVEDLSELDGLMANRNKKKSTDSEGDTPTDSSNSSVPYDTPEHMRRQTPRHSDSSNSSVPYDTPEHMRRQIPRHSDVSIQKPDNESIASLNAPDLGQSLSSVSKSANSHQTSQNDAQNGPIAKRRKMTNKTNRSTEYPSSPDLTTARNSEDPISDEAPNLGDDNQNVLQITEQPTKNANAYSNDQAASKTDQNETEKSSEEENSHEHPCSTTFTDKFDFVASLPNHPDTEIAERDEVRAKSMADKNSEEIINEAATKNKSDENVNETKIIFTDKAISSAVRGSDDVIKDSDYGRVDISPILPSTARRMRKSRRGTKIINRSVLKKDRASQTENISFHPHTSERERSVNENLPFGYLSIYDTYRSRYPSKIVLGSLNPFVRNL